MSRYTYKHIYQWDADIAYVVGLFASDGCVINNGRHLAMTSKDYEIIEHVQQIIGVHTAASYKSGQFHTQAYHLQFSNVAFYDFLLAAGVMPVKSKTIGAIMVPSEFYADFLRGYFDGDGTIYGFQDSRWKSSYMYYCGFVSASPDFLSWLQKTNESRYGVGQGSIHQNVRAQTLLYAKQDAQKLFTVMYAKPLAPKLTRKYLKFRDFIASDPHAKITGI